MKPDDRLEDFIKANREAFDNLEPSPDVWKRIQKDSSKTKSRRINPVLTRVAAVVAVIAVTAALLYTVSVFNSQEYTAMTDDPELLELLEAESYYSQEVNVKMKEIRKCYYTFPELKDDIETDLNELEQMYFELKKDLKDNVSNKEVIEAMIENNRYRLKLVDDVLEQINC